MANKAIEGAGKAGVTLLLLIGWLVGAAAGLLFMWFLIFRVLPWIL